MSIEADLLRELATEIENRELIQSWINGYSTIKPRITHFQWEGASSAHGNEALRRGLIEQIEEKWSDLLNAALGSARDKEADARAALPKREA